MPAIRQPAVSGTFYPGFGPALRAAVNRCLPKSSPVGQVPKALIVPHAGYIYSGPIAGSAYSLLVPGRATVRRVVLIGPSHRVGFTGVAASRVSAFRTPLGDVPVDTRSVDVLLSLPMVRVVESAHAQEHSIEVQLPFLQTALSGFAIVPLLTGSVTADEVARVLQASWDGADTVIIVSTDLTHYLPYDVAAEVDAQTASAVVNLDPDAIGDDSACGHDALRGMLLVARMNGLQVRQLDLRNSGDTAGRRDAVVGYGAFALF